MFEQLKYDLRQIRFYYQRKKVFDEANSIIGENGTVDLAKRYNQAICNAMPQLYELYYKLYVEGLTQARRQGKLLMLRIRFKNCISNY